MVRDGIQQKLADSLIQLSQKGILYNMGNVNVVNQLLAYNGQPTALGKLYIGSWEVDLSSFA